MSLSQQSISIIKNQSIKVIFAYLFQSSLYNYIFSTILHEIKLKIRVTSNFTYILTQRIPVIIIKMNLNQSQQSVQPSNHAEKDSNHQDSSLHDETTPKIERNGKWTNIQHVKYIVFMELHRDQFKSRQRRRANKFYKQMSKFIKTRNPLQCRSHHQKLQDRYCYANKIILAFKQNGDMALYHSTLQELIDFKSKKDRSSAKPKIASSGVEVQIQTEINGVDTCFLFNNQLVDNLQNQSVVNHTIHWSFNGLQQLSCHMPTFQNRNTFFYYQGPSFNSFI